MNEPCRGRRFVSGSGLTVVLAESDPAERGLVVRQLFAWPRGPLRDTVRRDRRLARPSSAGMMHSSPKRSGDFWSKVAGSERYQAARAVPRCSQPATHRHDRPWHHAYPTTFHVRRADAPGGWRDTAQRSPRLQSQSGDDFEAGRMEHVAIIFWSRAITATWRGHRGRIASSSPQTPIMHRGQGLNPAMILSDTSRPSCPDGFVIELSIRSTSWPLVMSLS